jgi:hypothetical protein
MLWRKVISSKSYHSEHKVAVVGVPNVTSACVLTDGGGDANGGAPNDLFS